MEEAVEEPLTFLRFPRMRYSLFYRRIRDKPDQRTNSHAQFNEGGH